MDTIRQRRPWYQAGLAFECSGCGRCCAGPEPGFVWVSDEEVTAIAAFLRMDEPLFRRRFVRTVGRRQSHLEKRPSNDCIFLTARGPDGARGCEIYSVRPTQCRTWPFWECNISDPYDWAEAGGRCPGINRGPLHEFEEIRRRAEKTRE